MYFAIRDDDISYFSSAKNLKKIYNGIWDFVPISFAVIPFVHGSAKFVPKKYKKDKKYPIGNNKNLVDFLKRMVKENNASIMLHGYSHRLNNKGHEFVVDDDLFDKVKEGREYLESLFDTKIKSFVAPSHSFSKKGFESVIKNKLNIIGSPALNHRKILYDWRYIKNVLMLSLFRISHEQGIRYPHVIKFKEHKELYCYSIVPSIDFNEIKKGFYFSKKKNGIFCVAMHSATINEANLNMLRKIVKESSKFNVKYTTIDDIV